jgi:zinc/manganese transport system substrate-binding protein
MKFRAFASLIVFAMAVIGTSGCTAVESETEAKPQVVASLSVWGNLATYIGGDLVEVTNLVDDPSQDPHSFEASARDQLALSKADLVIANGGGFDPFIDQMLANLDRQPTLVKVEDLELAIEFAGNEHAWYSIPTVQLVAQEILEKLQKIDSANAEKYQVGFADLQNRLAETATKAAALADKLTGKSAITTEPLVDYLLTDLGVAMKTPASFAEAIEEERDASVADLELVANLIRNKKVDMLILNSSTETTQIAYLVSAAEQAQLPIFEFSELPPQGDRYSDWINFYLETIDSYFE